MHNLQKYLSTWFDAIGKTATNKKQNLEFPGDLVEEILSWVPARSLARLRYTCKQWKTLITNPRFVNKHLSRMRCREQQSTVFNDVSTVSPSLGSTISCVGIDFNKPCVKVEVFKPVSDSPVCNMSHCDGLLLLFTRNKLLVLNPLLKQARWIDFRYVNDRSMNAYGLGYNSNHEYKIVGFSCRVRNLWVEVYEFKYDCWKVVAVDKSFSEFEGLPFSSVCLRGTPYWIGHHEKYHGDFSIQSFDFSKERFETLCLFHSNNSTIGKIERGDYLSLGIFRGDHLTLLHGSRSTSKIQIWVMMRHWTRLLTVSIPEFRMYPTNYSSYFNESNGELVLSIRHFKTGSICIINVVGEDDQELQKVEYYSSTDYTVGECYYVPSLLQVPCFSKSKEKE